MAIDVFSMDGSFRIEDKESGYAPLGVESEIPLAPALILFGPNDSGKTNVMRMLSQVLRGSGWVVPRDRFRQERWPNECRLTVRLDLNNPAHCALLVHAADRAVDRDLEYPLFDVGTSDHLVEGGSQVLRLRGRASEELEREYGEEPDRAALLIESLREALRTLVADSTLPPQTDDVVDRLVRSLQLGCYRRGSYLQLDDDALATSLGLDDENVKRVRTSVGGYLMSRGRFCPK